jgi:CheY-like chemotaxis protein
MTNRSALVIEVDESFASALHQALTPYGFRVDHMPDGNQAIEVAQADPPDIILLSVEPKNVGYAICNKIKKHPGLKGVPLILMSADASPETFEQHRKLKTRADEYFIKGDPNQLDALLQKIDGLIPLGEPVTETGQQDEVDIPVEEEGLDEISLDDSDVALVDDEGAPAPEPPEPPRAASYETRDDEKTRVTIESDIDDAFAGLELGQEKRGGEPPRNQFDQPTSAGRGFAPPPLQEPETPVEAAPVAEFPPQATDPGAGEEPAVEVAAAEEPVEVQVAETEGAVEEEFPVEAPGDGEGIDLGIDQVQLAPPPAEAGEEEELRTRVVQLEEQRTLLKKELQEAKAQAAAQPAPAAAASAPFSREREFLNLREIINRKEKEILDLKDELDAKERTILDHKDKVRELERKSRDLDERILHFERQLVAANEKLAALGQDKEKGLERERQLKARIDDAQRENQKAHDDFDALKKRHATQLEQAKSELDRARAEAAQQKADGEAELRATVDRLTRERQESEVALRAEHSRIVEGLRADSERRLAEREQTHAGEIGALTSAHQAELQTLRERARNDLETMRRDHEAADLAVREEQAAEIQSLKEAHAAQLAEMGARYQAETTALERQRDEMLGRAEQRRQGELSQAEQRRVAELQEAERQRERQLGEAEQRRQGELAQADQRRLMELGQLDQQRQAELGAAEQRRGAELAAQGEAFRQQTEQLNAKHAAEVADLQARHEQALVQLEGAHAAEAAQEQQKHQGELADAQNRYAALDAQRKQELEEAQARHLGLEQLRRQENEDAKRTIADLEHENNAKQARSQELGDLLDRARKDLEQRDQAIATLGGQIDELERQSASFQDQALRAMTKIRNDQALAEKAKKAIAIALTLVEEQGKAGPGEPPAG